VAFDIRAFEVFDPLELLDLLGEPVNFDPGDLPAVPPTSEPNPPEVSDVDRVS